MRNQGLIMIKKGTKCKIFRLKQFYEDKDLFGDLTIHKEKQVFCLFSRAAWEEVLNVSNKK